jgi:hypothetical protein
MKDTQKKYILKYLFNTYEYSSVNQLDCVKKMTLDNEDAKVFMKKSNGLVSNIYNFYRKELVDDGLLEVSVEKKSDALQDRIKYLKALLVKNNIEF